MFTKDNIQRCYKVFDFEEQEWVCDIGYEDNQLILYCYNEEEDCSWRYEPDMTERQEALNYILGKRDDFND